MTDPSRQPGYTLAELMVAIAIGAMMLVGLQQLLGVSASTIERAGERTDLLRQGRFAMARIVDAVGGSTRVLIPLADNPSTAFVENIREQTFPASAPPTGSSLATAVLAVTLNPTIDLDGNGVPDADNDADGLVDEDLPADTQNDGRAGVRDFDDDGNGVKDFFLAPAGDDDESNDASQSEDPINGIDDDGDGTIDEDPAGDMNGDGAAGIAGVDDDGDGTIDEGAADDDDEDGQSNEDWYDPVVFYLQGSALIERRAVPWDESGDGAVTGRDYVESTIADNVSLLRFERLPPTGSQHQLIDITLDLDDSTGEPISLTTRVRLGSRL